MRKGLDGRHIAAIPQRVEIGLCQSASWLGLGRLLATGHDYETHTGMSQFSSIP
jgi:hypothetical protein